MPSILTTLTLTITLALAIITTATATTGAGNTPGHRLNKRCSPRYDPDLALGYDPPAPCWQTFDPACRPFLAEGTEMTLDAAHGLAVVYGVSEHCKTQIVEELRREAAGGKNYDWVQKHGTLTVIPGPGADGSGNYILVISNMSEQAVARYTGLTYLSWP
ncbi:hypothetical protein N656DRAFT_779247 [Canariomyces notabilis]|uniref:Ecp2 effector protein domain-containing protein n=1 Tax=Canariomyces notabilis TaxID=2074819 RepID=A0AAN6TDJ2_9PEZI|nr:hypothetical protein N656DRAFT_779247 [Canariomyces arenarius]